MTDLHEASDRAYIAQIDSVGWIFAVLVVVIAAIAGIMAYCGNNSTVASSSVAHEVAHDVASR
jgi:hypothetical protein